MSRPFKPEHIPSLIPYLTVGNASDAISFYKDAFQFELSSQPKKHEGQYVHVEMKLGDAMIMFAPEGAWGTDRKTPGNAKTPCPVGLYIYVEDVDKHFENAKKHGATVVDEPQDTFWGDRMSRLRDPFGYDWSFATNVKDHDPSASPL